MLHTMHKDVNVKYVVITCLIKSLIYGDEKRNNCEKTFGRSSLFQFQNVIVIAIATETEKQ